MDDLAEKLSGILNDPESMAQVRKMAEGLFSQNEETGRETMGNPLSGLLGNAPQSDGFSMPDATSIMRVVSLLKNSGNDSRSGLLLALKPHLSEERQERVDKAVKILKLVSLMPILKEQGLLNL